MVEGNLKIKNVIINPTTPIAGSNVTVTVESENIGGADRVWGQIAQNGVRVYDDCYKGWGNDCIDLPGTGNSERFWNFTSTSFVMPNDTVIIISRTFHCGFFNCPLDIGWNEDDRKTIQLSPGVNVCTSAAITPNKTTTNKCDTVKFTLQRNPAGNDKGHLFEVINNENYDRGSALTDSTGKCEISHIIRTPGAHTYYAYFESGCTSINTTVNITDAGDLCSRGENCEWYDVGCSLKAFWGDNWIWFALIIVVIILLLGYLIITRVT